MTVTYGKLWTLVKYNKMKKKELAISADFSQYTMTKLNQARVVSVEMMIKLYKAFNYDIGDLIEVIEDD